MPLLLIDDEADNASVNTKEKRDPAQTGEETASAINQRIRTILLAFEKSAYVGYTATPFANIFINPQAKTEKLGRDIFPSSFIINVKPPSNYVGPAKVFGLNGDPDAGIAEAPGLPIVRKIDDYEEAFPPKHKRDHVPPYLPESLRRAVRCFVLACAARQARGQLRKHSSMLVHVTRFVEVQGHVVELVKEELRGLQRRLEFGDGSRKPTLRDELRDLWLTEFEATSSQMPEDAGPRVTWDLVEPELFPAASKIAVLAINGYAKTALDYKEHEAEGRYVIAVGGDKLSRGLTLEGLCVSYFLRTSKMYDTLMQMGRWFGYRPGYLDLCRLFTTEQLVRWYRHIALAEIELRREFDYMVAAGLTPEKYGLRVRSHPDGMIVTALNKMCHSETLELSWAGVLVQTTQLPKDQARVAANVRVTESLLAAVSGGKQESAKRTVRWTSVSGEHVAKYVESLQLPKESARADGAQLAAFIRKQMSLAVPELTEWTVALIGSSTGRASTQAIGGFTVGLVERTPDATSGARDTFALRKANIISPSDQAVDLEHVPVTPKLLDALCEKPGLEAEIRKLPPVSTLYELAVELTRLRIQAGKLKGSNPEPPNGRVVREVRPKQQGLLLIYPLDPSSVQGAADPDMPIIGVALSFPTSDSALGIEYVVNKVWGAEIEEDAAYDD